MGYSFRSSFCSTNLYSHIRIAGTFIKTKVDNKPFLPNLPFLYSISIPPENIRNAEVFLPSLGGTEIEHWTEMS